ncbi:hypothetical protein PT974_05089 [Cladobotryum mycophilum]|uniref:Uncharacterized protein n=1 Tax=Cladobotryum mycophilum TaxID=491253 RepID=A0ABR0SSA4_9HYPO
MKFIGALFVFAATAAAGITGISGDVSGWSVAGDISKRAGCPAHHCCARACGCNACTPDGNGNHCCAGQVESVCGPCPFN